MNKNINNFIYSKILDENKLKKNEEILNDLFAINMDDIFDKISVELYEGEIMKQIFNYGIDDDDFEYDDFEYDDNEYNKIRNIFSNYIEYYFNDYSEIVDSSNIKEFLKGINKITLGILEMNNYSVKEYYCINPEIESYIFNNLKYKMYIEYELNKDNKLISKKEAISKYMKTYDSKCKNKDKEDWFKDIVRYKSKNIIRKINRLKKDCIKWGKIENIYVDKNKIYSVTSNVYMEIIENHSKNLFYKNQDIKESKDYYVNNLINHVKKYIDSTETFSEIYFFERSTNILFILIIYIKISRLENKSRNYILYDDLISINYLPNIIDNNLIIDFFINISLDNKYCNELKKNTEECCIELAFLIIPLYEMVFASIVKKYCNKKNIKYDRFLSIVYEEFDIHYIKNIILNNNIKIEETLKYEEKFRDRGKEFREFLTKFNETFDLNIFNKKDFIYWIGPFNKKIIKNIKGHNIKEYQKKLKDFLMNIVNY